MIRKSIKNYFINLKYIFTPLGILALGVIIGLSILVPGILSAGRTLIANIKEIIGNANFDVEAFKNSIVGAGEALDWSDPAAALHILVSSEWLSETLKTSIQALLPEGQLYATQISNAVNIAVTDCAACVVVLIVWIAIGVFGGVFFTKFLIRREIAKRALWKYFLATLVDSILIVAVSALAIWLSSLWSPAIILIALLALVLSGVLPLFEAYLVHGLHKVECADVVNIKNVGKLWLSDVIVFAIACVFVAIAFLLFGKIGGFFIAMPLIEVTAIFISLNAEAYVKDFAANASERAQASLTASPATETAADDE